MYRIDVEIENEKYMQKETREKARVRRKGQVRERIEENSDFDKTET